MTAHDIDGYSLIEVETEDEWREATLALDEATEHFWTVWQEGDVCLGLRAALDDGGYALLTEPYGALANYRDSNRAGDSRTHWVLGIYASGADHEPVIHELSGLDPANALDDEQMAASVAAFLDPERENPEPETWVTSNRPEYAYPPVVESAWLADADEPSVESGQADDDDEPWVGSHQLDEQTKSGVRTTIAAILVVLAHASAVISALATVGVETYLLIKLGVEGDWAGFFSFLFIGSFVVMTIAYWMSMALAGALLLVARLFDRDALR